MFALLDVAAGIGWPRIETDQGSLAYNYQAGVGTFDMGARPFTYTYNNGTQLAFIIPDANNQHTFKIRFNTDGAGNVIPSVIGAEFSVYGTVDTNFNFMTDPGEVTGELLSGEILAFGWQNNPGTTDAFDFRFAATGGALLTAPSSAADFAGKDIGVTMASENSNFDGTFTRNFVGGPVKAIAGPIKPEFVPISISGTKTEDKTGDGFSADDSRLGGTRINLYRDSGNAGGLDGADSLVTFTTTDSNGDYSFSDLGPGTYYVQEVLLAGWSQTGGPSYYTVTATSNVPSAGNDFANFRHITVSGTKYNDITGNGITGDDEPLADVTIELVDESGGVVASTTTDSNGDYSFPNVGPGKYTIREVVPGGWLQTGGPVSYTITATSGTDVGDQDFSNFEKISISGKKYDDRNGDGLTAGDSGLGGVTIQLFLNGLFLKETTTAGDGTYSFADLGPGEYVVKEVLPDGSVQTLGEDGYTISAESGADATGNDFANFKKISISGKKYDDKTGDGITGDDTGLGGVTIQLYLGATKVDETVTASDGTYSFADLRPGEYTVKEVLPDGSVQTVGADGYTVSATSGTDAIEKNFANFKKITIRGTKFRDITGNSFSGDDTPLGGVTIKLYDAANNEVGSTVTAANGTYKFENLGPGTYFVQEVVPAGYNQTGGNAGYQVVAISGTDATGKNFANYKLAPDIDIEKLIRGQLQNAGGEGKTPGFWKQTQHFYAWTSPYVPTGVNATKYNAVFGLTSAQEDPTLTLLGALGRGGGEQNALGRHAAAALLNAANPNISYLYTTAQIIAMVQNAYATGDFEHAKNLLASQNELEADLSTPAPVSGSTGDQDADSAPGITVAVGAQLTFTFVVKNTGQTPLINVVVVDDNATPGNTADDFSPTYVSGDTNNDSILDLNETWIYTYVTTAKAGQHTNNATVTGKNIFNPSEIVDDDDPANYTTEDGQEPALTSISGKKFRDVTGNSLTSDDVPLGGVTIKLYKDLNNDGKLTSADGAAVRTTVTAADGSYSFDGLNTGKYLVQEVVTGDYVRTYPLLQDYHSVNAADTDEDYGGVNFANFDKNDCFCAIGSYYFLVNGNKVYDLRGNTNQGDTVKVVFTIKSGYSNVQLSLVSYKAPAATFDANTAYLQEVFQYQTGTFNAGTYSMTVANPNCYYQVDFVCGAVIDQFGPAGSNVFYTPQNRLISADNDGTNACTQGTSSISGIVYVDHNNDGDIDPNEGGIKNVKVVLTGTNDLGQYVELTDYTDANGFYLFTNLRDGTYKVTETQPTDYNDGKDSLGSLGGTQGNDVFSNVVISGGNKTGINYNFGEISKTTTAPCLTSGMTATIGFWQNKNGQALIKAMNGSANCTKLGTWLATNFPNLFGNTSGTACNLSGKTNTQVADTFVKLFNVSGMKVEAQVLATALAVYATDSDLAGGTYAKSYGFTVNTSGTGAVTYNVGSLGSSIGLTNYKSYTITQILTAANTVDAFDTSSSTQTKVNTLFTAINETGDI